MKENKIAYLLKEGDRLYIEWVSQSVCMSKTDVTPLWHFFKDNWSHFENYMKQPESE